MAPKPALARVGPPDAKFGPQLLHRESSFSQNGHLTKSGNALGSVTENGEEIHCRIGESIDGVLKLPDTAMGSVNTNDSPKRKPELQIVNSRDRVHLKMEANHKFVNNRSEDLQMENRFKDEAEVWD